MRADSLASVLANYSVLLASLENFAEMSSRDMEMSARVNGIAYQLGKFDFLFGVMLGKKILRLADNLSRSLQQKDMSAAEATVLLISLVIHSNLFARILSLPSFGRR